MSDAKKTDVLARMISTGTGGVFSRTEPKDKQVRDFYGFLLVQIISTQPSLPPHSPFLLQYYSPPKKQKIPPKKGHRENPERAR